jgi:hypothetical protein
VRLGGDVVVGEISVSEPVVEEESSLPSWEPSVGTAVESVVVVVVAAAATVYFLIYCVSGKKKKIAKALTPARIPVNYLTIVSKNVLDLRLDCSEWLK